MEDVPENLNPRSIILESIQQLEELKKEALEANSKQKEFKDFVKALKLNTEITSCSHSLPLLFNDFKA